MSLDGVLIHQLKHEIEIVAQEARVDRIVQPSRDEIILHLRWRGGGEKLLLSAGANNARLHFIETPPENPEKAPMFCMLLRKHLQGARLLGIRQLGMDRILFFDFEAYNELGDLVTLTLVLEIMGRHSNIILLNEKNIIMDSIHRVDFETSSVRQVLSGLPYELPPQQDKYSIVDATMTDILAKLKVQGEIPLSKGIMNTLQGFSPLPCREIAFRIFPEEDFILSDATEFQWINIKQELEKVAEQIKQYETTPTMLLELKGRPRDITFLPIHQYGDTMKTEEFPTFHQMLDTFFQTRDTVERIRQRSGDLHRLLENTLHRIEKRIAIQKQELIECQDREKWRIQGELLTANLHVIQKGMDAVKVSNYYDPDGAEVTIPLDIRKTPSQNAQHYYALYRKADTAEKKLTTLITQGEEELRYVESIQDSLKRAQTEGDLDAIRMELAEAGYIRRSKVKKPNSKRKLLPHSFLSSDGFTIYAGRNNMQNDKLTLKDSSSQDIWFHTQNIPGSHVIVRTEGKEVPARTLEEAAMIAAYHSKAQGETKIPVDYTQVRYVKKPAGAKPGMVHYDRFQTLLVDSNEKFVISLKK